MAQPVILVIDDEPDLLHVLSWAIQKGMPGYRVEQAVGSEEAEDILDKLAASGSELALVVTDHVLGGDTGLDVLDRVRERFPAAQTMLYTGQAAAPVEERARANGVHVLWKPVRLRTLLGEVESVLAGRAA